MIIVNTVVYVRAELQLPENYVPLLMSVAGAGSMLMAFVLPKLLLVYSDRTVMLTGAGALVVALAAGLSQPTYFGLFPIWFLIGLGTSAILITTGRVVRDSCKENDRNEFFSANFALTHLMWLVAYLLAGWLGNALGMVGAFAGLGGLALTATLLALKFWRANDEIDLWHDHAAVTHSHTHIHDDHHRHEHEGWEGPEPHVHEHQHEAKRHRHKFIIDAHHLQWPR